MMFEVAFVMVSVVFSVMALAASIYAIINIEAFKRSTHQVTILDPKTQKFETITDEMKDNFTKEPFDTLM